MINKYADYFEDIAKQIGLSIKIPRPGRTMKNVSAAINGLIGIGFIASGVVFRKVPLTLLGVLGLAGSVLLAVEEEESVIGQACWNRK